jgi:hypothetical protein
MTKRGEIFRNKDKADIEMSNTKTNKIKKQ